MKTEKVIVERKRKFSESRYSVGIYIDDEFIVNTIKNNRQEIELCEGRHLLKVIQGNRSGEIEINVKRGKILKTVFSSTRLSYLIYLSFIVALTIYYGLDLKGDEIFILYIPTIIITIYTYTIGRKNYFIFENPTETDSWQYP